MRFGLKEAVIAKINKVFDNYPQVESVILYGSRAKGNYKPGSDIDLTLTGNDINLSLINKIELALDDLLLPYTFDISSFHYLNNHALLAHIARVGKLFYRAVEHENQEEFVSEWRETTLGKISLKIQYGYTQSASDEEIGPKFLRITDIQNDIVDFASVPYCEISDKDLRKYKLKKGDICIARTGASTGATAYIKNDINAVFASYLIRYQVNQHIAYPLFIGFAVRSFYWKGFVKSIIGGSAQPGANAQQFAEFPISLPPLPEQRRIADVLSTLDAKIELLRRQNRTLEQIAQTLFKHWFVKFEFPNEDGQPYKSSGGAMQPSELGEIPAGWMVKPLDKIADFLNGLALQKYPPEREDIYLPVIKIRELKSGITDATDKASPNILSKYIIKTGDVIFSWSGSLEVVIWNLGKGALNQHLFMVSSKTYHKWFYYFWLLHHLGFFRHIAQSKTTTMGHIQRHHLTEALCVIPDNKTLQFYNNVFTPILNKTITNNQQIHTLTRLRDSLLPKLMSGKIRVTE